MSTVIITKGKLLKGDKVEIDYTRKLKPDTKPALISGEYKDPPHTDLKKSFETLRVHAALIGGFIAAVMVPEIKNLNEDLIKDYTVTGFTIFSDKNDSEGVILTAHKILKTGKSLGFNTPITRFDDESDSAHPFMDELMEAIDDCRLELKLYLDGKYADDPQGKLDLPEQK